VDAAALETFIAELKTAGYAPNTIVGRVSAISAFYRWCVREQLVVRNPVELIRRPPRPAESSTASLTRHQLTDWLAAAKVRGGAWWAAAMLLGLNGLRCGELTACNVEDLGNHSWHHTLKLTTTKGDRPTEAGIDLLREALGGARALGQPDLLSETLTSLGSALIHAVRGADQDAVGLLHEAVCLYESVGDPASTATAMRELGYVEMLRGRYPRADVWFTRAAGVAGLHDAERAWIGTYSGAAQCDVADYPRARRTLDDAVARAHAAGPPPVQTLARSMRGRLHLATGDLDAAATDLDQAIQLGVEHGLRTLVPWPMTIRAEIDLATGGVTAGMDRLEHAYATARQISDPCWEAMALRGLGLGHVHLGHLERGVALLEAAPTECRRLPDTYRWIEAHALDSLAAVSVRRGLDGAARWVQILEDLTTAHGMRQFSLNAARYRAALGDPGAAALAQTRHEALTVDTTIDPGKAP
jgi:tetratricopeptide (TPR) repeat protein